MLLAFEPGFGSSALTVVLITVVELSGILNPDGQSCFPLACRVPSDQAQSGANGP